MSIEEFDRITPVIPPIVKRNTKPMLQYIGASFDKKDPFIVANQLKIFTPVGIAIIMVADVKQARVSTSIPTVNMWWAQTINPKNPIETIA